MRSLWFAVASFALHGAVVAVVAAGVGGPRPAEVRAAPVEVAVVGRSPAAMKAEEGRGRGGGGDRGGGGRAKRGMSRRDAGIPVKGGGGDPFAIEGVSVPHGEAGGGGAEGRGAPLAEAKTGSASASASGQGSDSGAGGRVDVESVRIAVQRGLRYPRVARARGIEGVVVVRFAIRHDGSVGEVRVIGGADEVLAEEARAAVRRAAPFSSAPGTVKLPVEFALDAVP